MFSFSFSSNFLFSSKICHRIKLLACIIEEHPVNSRFQDSQQQYQKEWTLAASWFIFSKSKYTDCHGTTGHLRWCGAQKQAKDSAWPGNCTAGCTWDVKYMKWWCDNMQTSKQVCTYGNIIKYLMFHIHQYDIVHQV